MDFDYVLICLCVYLLFLQLYDLQRDDPSLARNMPPVAGRVGWVRHLYRKIEEPISYIRVRPNFSHKNNTKLLYWNISLLHVCHDQQNNSDILCSPEGQDVVKMYNQTAAALVEFESVYHIAWMSEVSKLDYGWFFCLDLILSYPWCHTILLFRLYYKIMLIFIQYIFSIICFFSLEYYTAGSSPKDRKISRQLWS